MIKNIIHKLLTKKEPLSQHEINNLIPLLQKLQFVIDDTHSYKKQIANNEEERIRGKQTDEKYNEKTKLIKNHFIYDILQTVEKIEKKL